MRAIGNGSSPLARGLRPRLHARIPGDRIIPARAGFTHPTAGSSPRRGGSSPLARGLRGPRPHDGCGPGIIPARAGFTQPATGLAAPDSDHPRSRGVYCPSMVPPSRRWGSSPLARGLLSLVSELPPSAGIIPARAGFTNPHAPPGAWALDHPRSRGVYGVLMDETTIAVGSSPLARGLRYQAGATPGGSRIIPARAGFTTPSTTRTSRPWDHPRSRGVYTARAMLRA